MSKMNWNKYRNNDGSINMQDAFRDQPEAEWMELDQLNRATDFLADVQKRQAIGSRQAAAIAITTALYLAYK